MLRDQLHHIKVDGVKRTAILDEENNVRVEAAEAIGRENDVQLAKIVWLSGRDMYKAYGSIVLYLTRASDARRLLEDGYLYAGGESGKTAVFERRDRPDRRPMLQLPAEWRRPQSLPMHQAPGVRELREGSHHHRDCHEAIPKCVLCGGPHPSFSRNCKKLYPSPNE